MNYYKVWFITKFYIRNQIKRKMFWFMFCMPLVTITLVPIVLYFLQEKIPTQKVVVAHPAIVENTAKLLEVTIKRPYAVTTGISSTPIVERIEFDSNNREALLEKLEQDLLAGEIQSFITLTPVESEKTSAPLCVMYVSGFATENALAERIQDTYALLGNFQFDSDLAENTRISTQKFAVKKVFSQFDKLVQASEAVPEQGGPAEKEAPAVVLTAEMLRTISYLLMNLCYFGVTFGVNMASRPMFTALIQEKEKKIIETLLSTFGCEELILGRLLGALLIGLGVMGVYIGPIVLFALLTGTLALSFFVWLFLYSLAQLLLLSATYFLCGSVTGNSVDANRLVLPVEMLTMAAPFVFIYAIRSPNSALLSWLQYVPYLTTSVAPVHATLAKNATLFSSIVALLIPLLLAMFLIWLCFKLTDKEQLIFDERFSFRRLIAKHFWSRTADEGNEITLWLFLV